MKKKSIFYGWWIVVSCFVLMFVMMSIVSMVMGIFVIPVSAELNISRTQFSLYFTILSGVGLLISPAIGMSKMDLRVMISLGVILCGICFMALGYCKNLIMFYIISVVMGIGFKICTNIPASILLANWFKEKSGTAVGIAFAGAGIGNMIFTPIANYLISVYGWRSAYVILGVLMMIITLPFTMFIIKNKPSDLGIVAYGERQHSRSAKDGGKEEVQGYTLSELMKTPFFWIIMFCMIVVNIVSCGINSHLPSYMQDIGHSATFAAFIVSSGSLMLTFGKVILGFMSDKLGGTSIVAISCAALTLSLVALMGSPVTILAIFAGLLHGFGTSFGSVGPPIITRQLFGEKDYSSVMSVVSMTSGIGMAIGAPFCGVIYDLTGEYTLSWIIFLIAMIGCNAWFLISLKSNEKRAAIIFTRDGYSKMG